MLEWLKTVFSGATAPLPTPTYLVSAKVDSGARRVCDDAVNMIVSFERMHRIGKDGLVHAYHDNLGYPTIGIGHLLSKVKWEDLSKYDPLTLDEAHELHQKDLDKFATGVSRLVKVKLTDNQFGALVSLAFNIGLGNLQASTLLRKLNRGDSLEDVGDEFLKWNKGGGIVLRGLTRRRVAERALFLS